MRKIKPFKLFDVTRILNPEERQRMMTGAVNRILAAESKLLAGQMFTLMGLPVGLFNSADVEGLILLAHMKRRAGDVTV